MSDEIRVSGSRTLCADVGIRDDDEGRGRIVFGTIVPYNRVATVNDGAGPYREMFAEGAFARSIAQRAHKIKLLVNHDQSQLPVGRAIHMEDRPEGPYGEFLVSRNHLYLLDDVADGIIDSFSVRFRGLEGDKRDGVVVRTEAALEREVSLVGFPAYADALIAGSRGDLDDETRTKFDRYLTDLLALADPGTGNAGPPIGHADAAARGAQLRDLETRIHLLKGRS